MNVRKSLAVLALAGAVGVGYVGVAGAQTVDPTTPSTPPATQNHKFNCDSAKDHLAKIEKRETTIKDRLAKGEAKVDQLRKDGKTQEADKLAKRLDTAKDRLTKVDARLDKLQAKIAQRCDTAPAGK